MASIITIASTGTTDRQDGNVILPHVLERKRRQREMLKRVKAPIMGGALSEEAS